MITFTIVHVVISLIGIASGLVVFVGLLTGRRLERWTALFLVSTVATSVTGFGFPFERLLPSHVFGVISLVALAVAIIARYVRHLAGIWGPLYVVTALLALYLNVVVLIVQSFLKVPALKSLAPTQTEAPFLLTQLVVLAAFLFFGFRAVMRVRTGPVKVA